MTARPAPRVLAPLARRITDAHGASAFRRDPAVIRRLLPVNRALTGYFSPEVRGVENVPRRGPALIVGNHSATFYMPDAWVTAEAVIERRGVETPTYGLAYDLLFTIPGIGDLLRRSGVLPADDETATQALRGGAAVVVFPGGDHDACRPWTDRDRVDFGDHRGFVRLALRCGVPVVPVVGHGAHHGVVVLARGEPLARVLGLAGVRVKVFPLMLAPPFGVLPIVTLPLPAHVTVQFLPALDWSGCGPDAADDSDVVEACYAEISGVMQDAMNRLHDEQPHPVATGVTRLAGRAVSTAFPGSRRS